MAFLLDAHQLRNKLSLKINSEVSCASAISISFIWDDHLVFFFFLFFMYVHKVRKALLFI